MSALDGFYSTWNKARETFGVGTPVDGSQHDGSSQLLRMKSMIDSAQPDDRWQGSGSEAYAKANKEHASVYQKLANLDQKLAAEITNAATIVTNGRTQLDTTKSWVDSAVDSLPKSLSSQAREQSLIPIANQGITQVNNIVGTAHGDMLRTGFRITDIKNQYDELGTNQKFGPGQQKGAGDGEKKNENSREPRSLADMGLPDNASERGEWDGDALAAQADLPPDRRNPEVLDRVADGLPPSPLSADQLKALADGKEVTNVPKDTLDYYREFYDRAGKDGLLALDRHLESKEAAGNTDAGSQRDRLANGLTVLSNEKVVEHNPDGSEAWRGGYDQLPSDVRGLIESRRTDPLPIDGQNPVSPLEQHFADVSQLGELLGEANPGYQPGTELGTELYLKAADMIEPAGNQLPVADTSWEEYQGAASSFADIAGRNNDASAAIWSGQGEHLPIGYDREHTVRTLLGEDWSKVGGGTGAATLLDWMSEDTPRSRQALIDLPHMLAPSDDDSVWNSQRDAFAHNSAVATEMAKVLAAHTEALSVPGQPFGFDATEIDSKGQPRLNATDAGRLLELGSYSEEGRANLATAAERVRIDELKTAMENNPGSVRDAVSISHSGGLSGSIDNSMKAAIGHQNDLLKYEATNPDDAAYRAKVLGANIAGDLSNELIAKIPGSATVADYTGLDAGEIIENKIKDAINTDEYKSIVVPDEKLVLAQSTTHAYQAILQAAYDAHQLPAAFVDEKGPIDVGTLGKTSDEYKEMLKYVGSRGLADYVTNFGQNYGIAVGVDQPTIPNKDDE